jgi:hypothetical protein
MAPMVSVKKKGDDAKLINNSLQNKRSTLFQIRKFIENNFENVGKNFSKKVREVYYDKKNKKAIYGTTTFEESKELAEEGIDLLSIPWVDKDN